MDVHSWHLLFDQFQNTLIHGPNIPGSYAVVLSKASDFAFTTRHIHTDHRFCFGPATSFFLELLIIILHSSPVTSILDTFQLVGLIFQCHIFLLFHTVHGVLMARRLEWFAISSSTGPHFVRILHYCHLSWVALHNIAHSFFEFCKPLSHNKSVIPL